jgi:hypothetical protein
VGVLKRTGKKSHFSRFDLKCGGFKKQGNIPRIFQILLVTPQKIKTLVISENYG